MQAAVRQSVVTGFNELARGLGTGLIVAAGSRCPACSLSCPACPSLTRGAGYPTAVHDGGTSKEITFGLLFFVFLVGCFFGGGITYLVVYDRGGSLSPGGRPQRGRVVRLSALEG